MVVKTGHCDVCDMIPVPQAVVVILVNIDVHLGQHKMMAQQNILKVMTGTFLRNTITVIIFTSL